MFSKFKVTSVSSAFTTHLPLIKVYEAEIRRLRSENEFLRYQNNSLVVQLNVALSQERKKASFNASQKRFFELTKAARNNKKRRIKNLVVQSLKFCAFVKQESSCQVDLLVPESERLIRKQLCASACSLRKFGEAVDSSLLLTKIVKIRCKTLIAFTERDLLLSRTCFLQKMD